jgi:hypothetical protein
MAELGPEARGGVDLLKLIDPRQDLTQGAPWRFSGSKLVSPAEAAKGQISVLRVPYVPPPEYDLVLTMQKLEDKRGADGSFDVGCAFPGGALSVVFDAHNEGWLYILGAEGPKHGGSDVQIKLFHVGKTRNVVIALRKTGVTVTVDGTAVMQWKSDTSRIGMYYTQDRDCLYLGAWIAYSISKFELIPVTGAGRKKR